MQSQHLLYIDILGFSALTKEAPGKIDQIFCIITRLRTLQKQFHEILMFSDTVIVKYRGVPTTPVEHKLNVRDLCAFATNLQYRLSQLDVFFRAVLLYGPFKSEMKEGLDCFFGQALIDAYSKEKNIKCVGLFSDKSSRQYYDEYASTRHNECLTFVYTSESLEEHKKTSSNGVTLDRSVLQDSCDYLLYDIKYLAQLHTFAHNHSDPDVRIKFLAAFNYYEQRYPRLIQALVGSGFDETIICPNYDWAQNRLNFELS